MHYETLLSIFKNDETLKEQYLTWFGVPYVYPYKNPNIHIGELNHEVRRAYHFEAIMYGLSGYFKANHLTTLKNFDILTNIYSRKW